MHVTKNMQTGSYFKNNIALDTGTYCGTCYGFFYLLVLNSVVLFSLEMVLYRAQSDPEKNMAAH